MVKINQNLHRLQVAWRDAQHSSSPAADNLREQFERLMTIYLSTKTAMTEPQMLQNCLNLQVSMAALLAQLAVGNEGPQPIELTFPLPDGYGSLAYVPGKQALPWQLPVYSHRSLTGPLWTFDPQKDPSLVIIQLLLEEQFKLVGSTYWSKYGRTDTLLLSIVSPLLCSPENSLQRIKCSQGFQSC